MKDASLSVAPFVVLWRVMDTCNLACPFCAYDKRLNFPRSTVDTGDVRRVIELLGNLQVAKSRPVMLSWLGGEPTLWDDFAPMVEQAAIAGLMQSLTTNGTTLGSRVLRERLIDHFDEVTLSVDAIGKKHEDLRGWKGGFSKLETWIPRLVSEAAERESLLRVRANIVLMRDTLDEFEELCLTLADWGVSQITFNQLGGRDRPEFFPANRLQVSDVVQLKQILPRLRRSLQARGVELLGGDPYVGRIAETAEDMPLKINNCQVAQNFLFIDEKGNIAPCAFVDDYFGVSVQNIKNLAQLAAVPERIISLQNACPASSCADCMSTQQFSKFENSHQQVSFHQEKSQGQNLYP